ncbi:FMN-dependent NADH-azoreductase [Planctomycetes bacterium MalM25]|nr:FMN-dependent NADH-azoreductase [Planctomycetes bacterium MalM25]
MAKLLYIEASPRKERSASISVANDFLDAYRNANPSDEIETWDLWGDPLPEFDGDTIDAKYAVMHGKDHTPEQSAAWEAVVVCCDRFKSADKYLLSLPMWNFGIPYKLKHFVDVIAQPGQTFSFSPETGYSGLVTAKPAAVIYARGGEYSSSDAVMGYDLQKPYMELLLGFLGFTDVESVLVEPTAADPELVAKGKKDAIAEAKAIAIRL